MTDSLAFARRVLAEAKVGIAAGYTFGPGNEDHVRLCFAIGTERLAEALRRVDGGAGPLTGKIMRHLAFALLLAVLWAAPAAASAVGEWVTEGGKAG